MIIVRYSLSRAIADLLERNPQGGSPENIRNLLASMPNNPAAREAQELLDQNGLIILYRGQGVDTRIAVHGEGVISPVARSLPEGHPNLLPELTGVDRSQRLYEQLTTGNYVNSRGAITPEKLAHHTAMFNGVPLPPQLRPPINTEVPGSLIDPRIGGVGIPATRRPGIAANPEWVGEGQEGVVYIVRLPRDQATLAQGSLLDLEQEHVIFNQLTDEYIYRLLRPNECPPGLRVDDMSSNLILAQ